MSATGLSSDKHAIIWRLYGSCMITKDVGAEFAAKRAQYTKPARAVFLTLALLSHAQLTTLSMALTPNSTALDSVV